MKNQNFWAGIAIMVGLAVLGAMLPSAVREVRAVNRTVSVKGLCEREVAADKVIWPLKFKVVGNELDAVYSQIERNGNIIVKFITDGGVDIDCISKSVPSISDKYAQEYGGNDRYYRYVASVTYTVCTNDVDKVLQLMGNQNYLIRNGVTVETGWDSEPQFLFEGLNDLKPEMIQEATRNAREAAQKFASDSDSKLGKIKTASQGTFSIENRDSSTPQIKKVRIVTYVDYYLDN